MTLVERRGERSIYSVSIYADDLFLCPECGAFHGDIGGIAEFCQWVYQDKSIGIREMNEFIANRRNSPEFQLKVCRDSDWDCSKHRAHVLLRMREAESAELRKAAFNAELSSPLPRIIAPREAERWMNESGHVYVIGGDGFFKIGVAKDVKKRVAAVQTSCPFRLSVVNAWKHDDPRFIEALLHIKYQAFHSSGEWYTLRAEDVQAIQLADSINNLFVEGEVASLMAGATIAAKRVDQTSRLGSANLLQHERLEQSIS